MVVEIEIKDEVFPLSLTPILSACPAPHPINTHKPPQGTTVARVLVNPSKVSFCRYKQIRKSYFPPSVTTGSISAYCSVSQGVLN